MWLLSTTRAELVFFVSPERVPGGYAILSHVWGSDEQSFQDIEGLRSRCAVSGENSRDLASEKIRGCCQLAEYHGYAWVWIDTCCIDKSSSAELSEAINSMFLYYSVAGICYAYLQDVPTGTDNAAEETEAAFRDSRWHTRGWTLQELIAPRIVLCVTQSWEILGSKADYAALLEEVTGVPATVPRLEDELKDISIAQRMSWASRRTTTRVEDEAYCLLGIFDINMPTLYGEGRKAFRRLQEEIMRQSSDTTLFAWGSCCELSEVTPGSIFTGSEFFFFAPAPSAFLECHDIRFDPGETHRPEGTIVPGQEGRRPNFEGIMTFSITPLGVLAKLPIVQCNGFTFADLAWSKNGRRLFLLLWPLSPDAEHAHPVYFIPSSRLGDSDRTARIVYAPPPTAPTLIQRILRRNPLSSTWKDVYLAHDVASRRSLYPSDRTIPFNLNFSAPFHLPQDSLYSIMTVLNADGIYTGPIYGLALVSRTVPSIPWSGTSPAIFTFRFLLQGEFTNDTFVFSLGLCTTSAQTPGHWAQVRYSKFQVDTSSGASTDQNLRLEPVSEPASDQHDHSCLADHILEWPNLTRTFSFALEDSPSALPGAQPSIQFTLSFMPYRHNPTRTLALRSVTTRVTQMSIP